MPLDHPARRTTRRTAVLVAGALAASAGLTVGTAAPALAGASGDFVTTANPVTSDGWYDRSITVATTFEVGTVSRVRLVECRVDGVPVYSDSTYRYQDFSVPVVLDRSSRDTGGTSVRCEATFQLGVFGAWSDYPTPPEQANGVFKLDLDGPQVSATAGRAPDHNGWYTSPTTLLVNGYDGLSGLATCGAAPSFTQNPAAVQLVGSGSVTVGCRDRVGNVATIDRPFQMDHTAPTLAPRVTPASVLLGGSATVEAHGLDAESGVASETCDPVDTSTVGAGKTVSCTATNNAGLSRTATARYDVGYAFSGFGSPVSAAETNIVKAGQALPLKFRLTDANGAGASGLSDVTVTAKSAACDLGATEDLTSESAAGGSGLQDLGNGSYQLNWKTPKAYAGSCKDVTVAFGDGGSATLAVRFVK